MRYDTLSEIEALFRSDAAGQLKAFSVPVPHEELVLNGQLYTPKTTDYFYNSEHPKQRIVLHFTAGNLRSDILSLTRQDWHVSVPFVIARDGTIYQLFPSKLWSGHIGAGVGNAKGTGNPQDKATIGIELSNYGILVPQGANLETIYSRSKDPKTGKIGPIDNYCTLDNKKAYVKVDQPFRDSSFFPSYTPEQLDSLIILLRFLTTKYNIPRTFLPEDKRYTAFNDVVNFNGIVSHVNYRSSGKWDIGPAFDWEGLIAGVEASEYTSIQPQAKGLEAVISTEEEIENQFPDARVLQGTEEETTDNEGYTPADYEEREETAATKERGLHALLIGINEYDRIRKLRGCIQDVEAVEKYLRLSGGFQDIFITKLLDAAASRENVIRAIRSDLANATSSDTILIYYSGHGTQEEADSTIWREETDGALECLVCHDGGTTKSSQFLLTDKELRFLIHELYQKTKAHIDIVFDCCNSGDSTRNGAQVSANYEDVSERRVTSNGQFFPRRAWSEFVFGGSISGEDVKGKLTEQFLPQGMHIQMSACESDQVALEVAGQGVFTKTLLKTLRDSGGNISYNALRSRIRQHMRAGYKQTPRVYVPMLAEKTLQSGFLNRHVDPGRMPCEATWAPGTGWQLNVGAIHGVNEKSAIKLTDAQTGVQYEATMREGGVFIDFTYLDASLPSQDGVYPAEVSGLLTSQLTLELDSQDATLAESQEIVAALETNAAGGFAFGGEEQAKETESDSGMAEKSDYTLHLKNGDAYVTFQGDPYRPLFKPIEYVGENEKSRRDAYQLISAHLLHISRWHFIKNLRNVELSDNFPKQPLTIEVFRILQNGMETAVPVADNSAELGYEEVQGIWSGTIRIRITNNTQQSLYISAAYLTKDFMCFLDFLPRRVVLLEAGKSLNLGLDGADRIALELGEVEQQYNWPKVMEAIQFIVSTILFDVEALTLEALEPPLTLSQRIRSGDEDVERGLKTVSKPMQFTGWTTQRLDITFENPMFNKIPLSTIKELLEWEKTAYFAAGLYTEVVNDENGFPTLLEPKKGLLIPEDERGILGDTKLWAGNVIETTVRRFRYRKLKKDPRRLRIVAEGDSWFQYPILLKDTLDQLYKLYAIRNFSEAGDTLANYLKEKKYLNAIEEENAGIFLVSGGGNDVIGEEFQHFLRETPDPADRTPRKYLNEKFFAQLDQLEALYTEMFDELTDRYPELQILVHCYDYVIPVDTTHPDSKKKSSWSGKYMIEKNIAPQAEREALVVFILDEFAARMESLAKPDRFGGKVTFIDTRKLVKRDIWFDEIHPKNEGFELVADKFVKEIERIKTLLA
jgi:N-acetyl-anhydromuramyl-L-alanine amidase AmpD